MSETASALEREHQPSRKPERKRSVKPRKRGNVIPFEAKTADAKSADRLKVARAMNEARRNTNGVAQAQEQTQEVEQEEAKRERYVRISPKTDSQPEKLVVEQVNRPEKLKISEELSDVALTGLIKLINETNQRAAETLAAAEAEAKASQAAPDLGDERVAKVASGWRAKLVAPIALAQAFVPALAGNTETATPQVTGAPVIQTSADVNIGAPVFEAQVADAIAPAAVPADVVAPAPAAEVAPAPAPADAVAPAPALTPAAPEAPPPPPPPPPEIAPPPPPPPAETPPPPPPVETPPAETPPPADPGGGGGGGGIKPPDQLGDQPTTPIGGDNPHIPGGDDLGPGDEVPNNLG